MFAGWDDDTIKALKTKWFSEGKTGRQVARELGTTRNAVISKINRMPPDPDYPARAERPAARARTPRVFVQAARELEAVAAPAPDTGTMTIGEVSGSGGCLWPFGDGPFTFCGRPKFGAGPYCAGHSVTAYQKVKQ
jgi:hypothetical protein